MYKIIPIMNGKFFFVTKDGKRISPDFCSREQAELHLKGLECDIWEMKNET